MRLSDFCLKGLQPHGLFVQLVHALGQFFGQSVPIQPIAPVAAAHGAGQIHAGVGIQAEKILHGSHGGVGRALEKALEPVEPRFPVLPQPGGCP